MKTKKVGKIVSLLVAIVLVATIMIPAASVLAQPSGYSGSTAADYKGEWTEVSSFTELNDAIEAANNAPEGSKAKTIHLRLTEDIKCLTPYMPDGNAIYINSIAWLQDRDGNGIYDIEECPYDNGKQQRWSWAKWAYYNDRGHSAEWLVENAAPYNVNSESSPFYGLTANDFKNGFVVTKAMQEYVGMGDLAREEVAHASMLWADLANCSGPDEKIGNEYSERMLIIEPKTNVTIDLNSHNISAGGTNIFVSEPKTQMSVFIVRGTLTIADLNKTIMENGALKVGALIGGTGNIYFDENVTENNTDVHRATLFDSDWNQKSLKGRNRDWIFKDGKWRVFFVTHSVWAKNATESRGGGVYVENGGTFNLEGGKITGNCAYMNAGKTIFATSVDSVTKGGGVFVEAGGKFLMSGGEISGNASRAYQEKGAAKDAYAYGGGVYLEGAQGDTAGAVMYMSGGKIAENATYSQVASSGSSQKSARAYGGGVYVGEGAVCSIIGNDVEEEKTDLDMVKTFPQVTNNSCGAVTQYSSAKNPDITLQGGGIYNGGTLNLKNALVTANDFAEGDIDIPEKRNSSLMISMATRVKRDADTGLALYIKSYKADGTPASYVTRLDDGFNENLELATEKVKHAATGVYGTMIGNDDMGLFSDGAGVCVRENAKLVVGERVWITDNYDLVTTGHEAFASVRDYKRTWQQEKNITDDRVVKTNDDGTGANYTDPAGGYVYAKEKTASDPNAVNENVSYTAHAMDGYAFSDTTDDVYLPEGQAIYKGGSLYETKIGVNYWNMVNADGAVVDGGFGQAGNRVIVKAGKDLTSVDPNGNLIWDEKTATPTQRDIQFFYLNDNNKNWERFKNVKRNANNDYYDYDKNNDGSPVYGYELPTYIKIDPNSAAPKTLCDTKAAASSNWDDRVRVTAIDTDNSAVNKDASPYEGYINYNEIYSAKRWSYGTMTGGINSTYDKETYRISDPTWSPDNDDFRPKGGDFSNAIVNFPQRAYPVTAEMKNSLPSSYLKAKYMDYKVVYDNSEFGASEPVLRFGTYKDTESVDTIRKMFVTINFDEANTHYYGVSKDTITYNNTDKVSANTDTLTTANTPFANVDASARFYGSDRVNGTIKIDKVVPDYLAYGKVELLNAFINMDKDKRRNTLTSISKDKDGELPDLYFKGWKYYTSYGDGPEVVTLSKDDAAEAFTANDNLTLYRRGYFNVDLKNIFNPNINSQPCPSLTAIWYTKEELDEARLNISNVKYQIVKRKDGVNLLRVVAIAGSDYPDFEAVGFVISTSNATPTIEGGYDYVTNDTTYERLGVTGEDGTQMCYDVDWLLGGKYYDEDNGGYHSRIPLEKDFVWTFGDGKKGGESAFAQPDNITTGLTGKKGYKDAGLFYTNIVITPENEHTVYFVTPYAKLDDGTYYYGESRAICYADYVS